MKVKCNFCKSYVERNDAVKRGINYFCDRDHADQAYYKLWAKSRPVEKLSKSVRENVYDRDHYRCCFCGVGYSLHLHHVVYRSEGGPDTGDNLITLCSDHHQEVHSNKKLYQPLCRQIIYLRSLGRTNITIKDLLDDLDSEH